MSAVGAAAHDTQTPVDRRIPARREPDDDARSDDGAPGASGRRRRRLHPLASVRHGAFGTKRRLSGKAACQLDTLTLDYDPTTGLYTSLGSTKDAAKDTTWRVIQEMGAVDQTPRSLTDIARRSGLVEPDERLGGNHRKHIATVLASRPEVGKVEENRRGQKTTLYRLLDVM